ncbi:hypothetical protein GEMRC1_008581 [Eukaryota sp. GEM-RC1]
MPTRLCTHYLDDRCNKGSSCKFAHVKRHELTSNICRFDSSCRSGAACPFRHSSDSAISPQQDRNTNVPTSIRIFCPPDWAKGSEEVTVVAIPQSGRRVRATISRNAAVLSTSIELPHTITELKFYRGSHLTFNPFYHRSKTGKCNVLDLAAPFSTYTMSDHLYGNSRRSEYIAGQVGFYFTDAYYPLYPQLQQEAASNRGFVPYNTILNRPRMKAYKEREHSQGKPPITEEEVFKCLKKIPHVICDKTRGIKPVNSDFGPVEDIKRTFISVFPLTSGAEVIEIFEHLRKQNFRVTSFLGYSSKVFMWLTSNWQLKLKLFELLTSLR